MSSNTAYMYAKNLKLDTRPYPSNGEILERIKKKFLMLPIEWLYQNTEQNRTNITNTKICAQSPTLLDIEYHNTYWQGYTNKNLTFKVFGAYWDSREAVVEGPLVRVLVMVNQIDRPFYKSYCQLWYDDTDEPEIVEVKTYDSIWVGAWGNKPRHLYPYLMNCQAPKFFISDTNIIERIPKRVSLVAEKCDMATNNVRIIYEEPLAYSEGKAVKSSFAVCVKSTFYSYVDMSARLVEWLELLRLLGVEKVFMYKLQLHANVEKVLNHYESTGFVQLSPFTYARGEPPFASFQNVTIIKDILNKRTNELIAYNDCLYRNMYKYNYLALIDVDEIIMPLGKLINWHELLEVAKSIKDPKCTNFASYCFRNVYFPRFEGKPPYSEEVPPYFYMLQHVIRVSNYTKEGHAVKCFHNTDFVVSLHNHYSRKYLQSCFQLAIDKKYAHIQHYREPDLKATLNDTVIDDSIWRYKDTLMSRSMKVLKSLNFLN
ncbi:uncharacterized protein LOC119666547 [Teleopsis dalmanni]|uniref:uncharacterized protein LOC119666547 n=1 Tax=Teleopsis dalmanni TaxID=139649 RepID=UPI0018CE26E1|nr:uncharacterized protein LOC119666547 [Teleopsis dalmanni]